MGTAASPGASLHAPKRALAIYAGLVALTVGIFSIHAGRLHSGAGPGLCARRRSSFRRKLDRAHRRGAAEGRSAKLLKIPGVDRRGDVRRLRRRVAERRRRTPARPMSPSSRSRSARGTGRTEQHHRERHAQRRSPTWTRRSCSSSRRRVIQGIGNGGGYRMIVQDRSGNGYQALEQAAAAADRQGAPDTGSSPTSSPCSTRRRRASSRTSTAPRPTCSACPPERVFEALQVYLGSAYVNDFNLLGRTYRVTAQADAPYPRRPERHRPA